MFQDLARMICLIDVRFDKAASDWITLQEENSSCKFGALQGIKVVRAGSYHTRPENQANDFEKVYWPYPGKRVNMLYVLKGFFFVQVSPIILALRKCFIDHCTSEYCVSDTTEDVTMVGVVWITKAILELINRLQRNWVPCMSPHSIAVR